MNDSDGPLPFRKNCQALEKNIPLALKRAKSFDYSLKSDTTKQDHVVQFIEKIIINGHAESAPPFRAFLECWHLPMFSE